MQSNTIGKALIFFLVVFIAGCATPQFQPAPFTPHRFDPDQYAPKVDNFLILFDASSSMTLSDYKGTPKINIAKDLVYRLNQTIPELRMKAGMRAFGQSPAVGPGDTALVYGIADYRRAELARGLDAIQGEGLITPIAAALKAAGGDLQATQGPIAVILVSDGADPFIPELPLDNEAKAFKDGFGDRLCIYTVGIGEDPKGMDRMQKLADIGGCGFFKNADELVSAGEMADFVERVFLSQLVDSDGDGVYDKNDLCPDTPPGVKVDAQGCPLPMAAMAPAADSDGDGVPDAADKCPNTPRGVEVNADGCRVLGKVLFDFDKSNLKPQYEAMLNEAAAMLRDNPSLQMEIDGHTDSIGTAEYNQGLSEKRAQSVKQYLIGKGIEAERLSIVGYGFRQPIATNETDQGRALNRRAELNPMN